jgi:hypothetical protein
MDLETGKPKLPPMDSEDGYCVRYNIGRRQYGGYSLLCSAPLTPNTCVVQLDVSAAVFALMLDDVALDLQWWEVVSEGDE